MRVWGLGLSGLLLRTSSWVLLPKRVQPERHDLCIYPFGMLRVFGQGIGQCPMWNLERPCGFSTTL